VQTPYFLSARGSRICYKGDVLGPKQTRQAKIELRDEQSLRLQNHLDAIFKVQITSIPAPSFDFALKPKTLGGAERENLGDGSFRMLEKPSQSVRKLPAKYRELPSNSKVVAAESKSLLTCRLHRHFLLFPFIHAPEATHESGTGLGSNLRHSWTD
jgi:hypothetical protein